MSGVSDHTIVVNYLIMGSIDAFFFSMQLVEKYKLLPSFQMEGLLNIFHYAD